MRFYAPRQIVIVRKDNSNAVSFNDLDIPELASPDLISNWNSKIRMTVFKIDGNFKYKMIAEKP